MAAPSDQGGVLEAMETGKDPVPHTPCTASGRMASA